MVHLQVRSLLYTYMPICNSNKPGIPGDVMITVLHNRHFLHTPSGVEIPEGWNLTRCNPSSWAGILRGKLPSAEKHSHRALVA